ncbi:MAG: hypothetical protein JNL82_36425 [Myxococcales bacterium]|nr:hypothetical protein [Myxococcales bacterium]
MKNPAHILDMILPRWRQLLPLDFPRPYFDAFIVRQRAALEAMVAAWLERREARRARGPESQTPAKRTRRNLEAMRLVVTRRPEDMTAEERRIVLGYSGWGGLSIADVADQFPPDLAPDDFALAHEYYTPRDIAEALADLVCLLLPELAGHDGAVRAFEPSVGIGRLIMPLGPPRCLVSDPRFKEIRWTAVELSAVSARMFAAMRPDVELYNTSIEEWMAEHSPRYQGAINLILANPPYGQRGEYARRDKHPAYMSEKKAYAYVMLRCLDLLVPGGVAVFLVPAGCLTGSKNRALRERLLRRYHLVVAFRLPSESTSGRDVFPGAGNIVDVLVWRARGGELGAVDPGDEFILDGRYFEEFPDHVLGTVKVHGGQWTKPGKARQRVAVVGDFTKFPEFTPRPMCTSCVLGNVPALQPSIAESVVRDMSDAPDDIGEELRHAMALGRRVDRYLALVADEDERALGLWPELHAALESLKRTPALAEHGQNPWRWLELRQLAQRRAVAQRLLTAYQQTGELAPSVATPPNIQPRFRAQPDDVLAQAEHLFRRGRHLTLDALAAFHREQGGKRTRTEILDVLLAASWCLDGEDWQDIEPEQVYLTGQLWPKHDRAAARAASDPQAARQLQRLVAVMNQAVFEDIRDVSPRQGWVPMDLVSAWISETLNARYGAVKLDRFEGIVTVAGRDYEKLENLTASVTPQTLWCIGWMNHDKEVFKPKLKDDEIEALEQEEAAATGKEREKSESEDGKKDEEEDIKIGQIRLLLGRHWDRAFARWAADLDERRAAVTEAYNRSFRGTVIPSFTADVLPIARWNEKGPQLRPHQIAGILRLLHFGGGLLAYDVGVGKTYTGIGFVALMRELGRAKRPVILVSSSLVWQWYDNIMCVLPDYRVAVIGSNRKRLSRGDRRGQLTSETDTPEERAAKWSALQAGLVDVVILSYDALGRTKMNEEALLEYVSKVEGIQRQITLAKRNAAEKKKEKLTERDEAILKHGVRGWVEENLELPEDRKFDPGIAWDDIGIDLLLVDEATAFKNSYAPEPREHGMPKYMGSAGDGSKRAWQLDFRAAAVRRRAKGTGIVLLTATPAKNSPLEFYNLIQLIDPHAFTRRGLMDPEQFIDRFLQVESRQIIDVTLKIATRSVVDGFKNLDDLRTIIETYGEFVSPQKAGLEVPEPRSEQVIVEMNDEQEDRYAELVREIEQALKRMKTRGSSSNAILGLLARLSLYALHPKLGRGIEYKDALTAIHPEDYASPKLLACAERVAASPGCGHIIFCEPTAVHQWLREVLVKKGIPRERIAIINGPVKPAERNRIANLFNGIKADPPAPGACGTGQARRVPPAHDVIIGNSVINEGLDLQHRTCALHHLDLPWTSSDLEQRNGRGVRQGNENSTVQIFYYLSARSMDWYRYQLIQGKRAWLSAVLESQARDTSNPGAQKSLSDEEILLMISRDPESTKRAIEERREGLRAEARRKVAREAASLLIQANARFRDARDTANAERAALLRAEGEDRLRDLQRIDVDAWPWARWTASVRDVEYMVPGADSAPVFEGLRVGVLRDGAVSMYFEFGRIVETDGGRKIGKRDLGSPVWELHGADNVRVMGIQPAELNAGNEWPTEEEQNLGEVLAGHVARTLVPGSEYADLQWEGASDAWLSRWWPLLERKIRDGLVRAGRRAPSPLALAEDVAEGPEYPTLQEGRLVLAAGPNIRGEILAPTFAGWRQFLAAMPGSDIKFGALHTVAKAWWQRKLPRGLFGTAEGATVEDEGDIAVTDPPIEETLPAAEPTTPSAAPAVAEPLAVEFAEHVARLFNRQGAGFHLRLHARHGYSGSHERFIYVLTREGSDDILASLDVSGGHVTDVRWLGTLRPAQQQGLLERLERALSDAALADAAENDTTLPDAPSSLQPLIETLERLGAKAYGMNVRRAQAVSRRQTIPDLAAALKDLAEPVTTTPEALALRLEEEDGMAAAVEVLRDPDILAFDSVDDLLDKLWSALESVAPLSKVKRRQGGLVVESAAIDESAEAPALLVREKGRGTRYRLRSVGVEVGSCRDGVCSIVPKSGELRSGAEVHHLVLRKEPFIRDLHAQVADLEHTLRDAPRLLSDVRQFLLVAGALIDTERCQGKEQTAALRAFETAKRHYDTARRLLVAGKTAASAERIHAAMRRIAVAAAHITEDCAAGQQNFIPAKLHVDAEDAAVLEET